MASPKRNSPRPPGVPPTSFKDRSASLMRPRIPENDDRVQKSRVLVRMPNAYPADDQLLISNPTIDADIKLAIVPAIIARKPSLANSSRLFGASAPMPPI